MDDEETFFKLVKAAFAQRRKTINNNYQNFFKDGKNIKESILKWQTGIDPKRRGNAINTRFCNDCMKKRKISIRKLNC